jgi:hypothetical protein
LQLLLSLLAGHGVRNVPGKRRVDFLYE